MPNKKWSAKTGREGRLRFGHAHLSPGDLCGVAADEVVHRMRWRQRANGRQHAESIACEKNHIGRMSGNAWDLCVLDELDWVRAPGVLGDGCVGVIDIVVLVQNNVLQHGTKTERLKNVGLAFRCKINRLGITTAFDVENSVVAPNMLIVTD